VTLKCLAEIAALNVGPEYDPKFVILFAMVMTSVNRMIPPSTNIAQAYSNAGDAGQELVLNLSMFLANFLSNHRPSSRIRTKPRRPSECAFVHGEGVASR
jgi:exportin-1